MKTFAGVTFILVIALMFITLVADLRNQGFDYDDEAYKLTLGSNKYDLSKPEQRWKMPSELKEISGIAIKDHRTLLCIQDENGAMYIYDLINESVDRKIIYGKPGDYEDIALIDNRVFVLKSDGQLYKFDFTDQNEADVIKIKTMLSEENDTEGLAFDPLTGSLLIACKNSPFIDDDADKGRAVYAFNLTENELKAPPLLFISKMNYKEALLKSGLDEKTHSPFQPSGIAIHPSSGRFIILCSVGKIMLILDRQGNIEKLIPLDATLFVQPEGICFGPSGELFISSEGKNGKGYILKF